MNTRTRKIVSILSLIALVLITSKHLFFIYLARDSFSPLFLSVLAILALVVIRFFYKAIAAEFSSDDST